MNQPAARSRHLLACLGDPSRFRIVLSLLEGDRCVTELAGEIGLSQSCTTRHLQYLEREGLVRGDRQGKRVMFRLRSDRPRVRELLAWVTATPAPSPGGHGGASLHGERPSQGDGPVSRRKAGGSRPPRSPRRGPPPAFDHPPAVDLQGGRDGQQPPAAHADPPSLAEPHPAAKPAEMEDWLL